MAEDVLKNQRADAICFGRESLADPEIPNKVKEGRLEEISSCIACLQSCIAYLFDPKINKVSCLVNPVTGYEDQYDLSEAENKKCEKMLYVIGDAKEAGKANQATEEGLAIALKI